MSEPSEGRSDVDLAYLDLSNRREPGPMQAHLLGGVSRAPRGPARPAVLRRVPRRRRPVGPAGHADLLRASRARRGVHTRAASSGRPTGPTTPASAGCWPRPSRRRPMAALEPRIAAIADGDLRRASSAPARATSSRGYAGPFPATAIAELLGVPVADRDRFREWSDSIVAGLGGEDLEQQLTTRREMHAYLGALVDERLAALDRGATLPDDVIARMCRAAHDDGAPQPQRDGQPRRADARRRARDHHVAARPDRRTG